MMVDIQIFIDTETSEVVRLTYVNENGISRLLSQAHSILRLVRLERKPSALRLSLSSRSACPEPAEGGFK